MSKNFKKKLSGYLFRILWALSLGAAPLIVKYKLMNFDPILSTWIRFFIWVIISFLILLIFWFFSKEKISFKTPINLFFWLAVAGEWFHTYFYHFSLQYTTATNFRLIFNFWPVLALIFAMFFWRKTIPFLRKKENIRNILILFIVWIIWTMTLSFWKISSIKSQLFWDLLAFISMVLDVVLTLSVIHYMKIVKNYKNITFIFNMYLAMAISFLPVLFFVDFSTLTIQNLIYSSLVWFLILLWLIFTYEAFKRIDGLLVYLMINFATLFTFILELFLFDLSITYNLIIWAILIISSSVLSEIINNNCEKEIEKNNTKNLIYD